MRSGMPIEDVRLLLTLLKKFQVEMRKKTSPFFVGDRANRAEIDDAVSLVEIVLNDARPAERA